MYPFRLCSATRIWGIYARAVLACFGHDQSRSIVTMPKEAAANGSGVPLPYGGLVLGVAGERGVAVYPGQSAAEVLKIAAIIQRELGWRDYGMDNYLARDVAREILHSIDRDFCRRNSPSR
jgi:hypothetical protein